MLNKLNIESNNQKKTAIIELTFNLIKLERESEKACAQVRINLPKSIEIVRFHRQQYIVLKGCKNHGELS